MDNGIFVLQIMKWVILHIILLVGFLGHAQSTDEQLAAQFYEAGDFEQAAVLYKKLNRNSPASMYIYENYLNCLVRLNDQNEALKLAKRQAKKYPERIIYQVDEAFIYNQFDEAEMVERTALSLIEQNLPMRGRLDILAQTFIRRNLHEYAVLAYQNGIDKFGLEVFGLQLMGLYQLTNQSKALVDLALEVLANDPDRLQQVEQQLAMLYEDESATKYLQQQTLTMTQRRPGNSAYDELLLEIYLQQKKFNAAMRQAIAIDKRNRSLGANVLEISALCANNRAYDAAISGYRHVVSLGTSTPNYFEAERGYIEALYLKTTQSFVADSTAVHELVSYIENFIKDQGRSHQTVGSMYLLSELYIFYDHQLDKGIAILEEITRTQRVPAHLMGRSKILLGDAYLMKNEIWDAKLMYGQVDKDFKEEPLGQQAKFQSAKLSYYTGDFEWARTQLDILRTATSQLISNNAMELALLIQDNTGLDSTDDAMMEYAQADFYLFQNRSDECMKILNMLPFKYPNHSLNDEIYYLKAQVLEKQGKYPESVAMYEKVYTLYNNDLLADNALYRSAMIHLNVFKDAEKAQLLFEKIILDHSSSLYAVDARRYYLDLKEGKSLEALFFEGQL